MAIPSGSGTEVLKRATAHNVSSGSSTVLLNGVADHIYTILSVTFCEQDNDTNCKIYMKVVEQPGGDSIFLLENVPLPASGTFTWNDKFVLTGLDHLEVYCENTGNNVDVLCSYIDQDWT